MKRDHLAGFIALTVEAVSTLTVESVVIGGRA